MFTVMTTKEMAVITRVYAISAKRYQQAAQALCCARTAPSYLLQYLAPQLKSSKFGQSKRNQNRVLSIYKE